MERIKHRLRRRDARLPDKLGLDLPGYGPEEPPRRSGTGYEYDPAYARPRGTLAGPEKGRDDIPDWVIEDFGDVDFGEFTLEEVWGDVNEIVTLAERLGLVPAPEATEQEVVSPEARMDWDAIREVGDVEWVPGAKALARPVQPGEGPEPTPTADQAEALQILRMGFGAQLSDAVLLGKQSDAEHLNGLRDTYQSNQDKIISGEMNLADVKEIVYGTRDIEIETRPTPTQEPTASPTKQPIYTVEEQHLAAMTEEWQEGRVSTLPYNEDLVTDYNALYWIEIPEGGLFYLPENSIVSHSGFGNGYIEWTPYYQLSGEGVVPRKEHDAAQYIAPGRVLSAEERQKILHETEDDIIMSTHSNLCGQLAMIAAMGFDLSEGLVEFALMGLYSGDQDAYDEVDAYKVYNISKGIDILNHPDVTTTIGTMTRFANTLAGSDYDVTLHSDQLNNVETSDKLSEMLNDGDRLILLVNIDTGEDGKLKAIDQIEGDGSTPHWVSVQDIITTKDGSQLVRVYNPYNNREEVYDWETFSAAWGTTEGNYSENVVIQISAVDDEQKPPPGPELEQGEPPPEGAPNLPAPDGPPGISWE